MHLFISCAQLHSIYNMDKPILLLKAELTKPISQALERIERIWQRKENSDDSIILEGLFALAVSSFENSILDTLRILLSSIPDKLDVKAENISKKELIDGNPLNQAIENKVASIGYKSLQDVIAFFTNTAGLSRDSITDNELNELLEIKATRNLLIHNNLIENDFYRQTAGPNRRSTNYDKKLSIDKEYLHKSLVAVRGVLQKFVTELSEKYVEYTKVRAVKELFKYIFKTPVMVFENEFEIDETKDVISFRKESSRKKSLSSTERFFYDVWISHTHGDRFEFKSGQFFSISDKDKFSFFIKNIDLLKT